MRSFGRMVEAYMKYGKAALSEKAPEGWEGTVKAMKNKKDIDNPYALSHWMKNQGYKSHESLGDEPKKKKKKKDETAEDMCSACEGVRVWHPIHGRGTITEVNRQFMTVNWDNLEKRITTPTLRGDDVSLLERIKEEYSSDPDDLAFDFDGLPDVERETTSTKRGDIDTDDSDEEEAEDDSEELTESMVAMGMSAIGGTYRGTTKKEEDLEFLTMDDLIEEEDRADYTNVPNPSDSVLAQQDVKKPDSKHSKPLSTLDGFDKAHNEQEPDGDYNDIMPDDAPDVPDYKELEDSSTRRRNTKKSSEGEHTDEAGTDHDDYKKETKPEDENKEEKQMGNESFRLTAKDLGLLMEGQHGTGVSGYAEEYGKDMKETHDPSSGEVAMTRDLLDKLLYSVSMQSPDEEKLEHICSGIETASAEKGGTLDVEDIETITQHIKDSYSSDASSDGMKDAPDDEMEGGEYDDTEREADEGCGDYARETEDEDGDEDDYYDEEDRAEGDGEIAGPEGGEEHEGKRQLMDRKGEKERNYDYENQKKRDMGRKKARSSKKKIRYGESKGGTSGTPIGHGSKKSGPGGGSTDEYGQEPSEDGGSNLLPAYPDGSQRGTPQGPWAKGKPASKGKQKPLAAESRKRRSSAKKKLDEAVMLGMASIPGTVRNSNQHPEMAINDDDDDAELKMIKRRSGIENWWKN